MKSGENKGIEQNATVLINDAVIADHDGIIELGGYWADFFKTTRISTAELQKVVWLNMMSDSEQVERKYVSISLGMLEFLPNVKDALIQYRNISDWQYLTKLSLLRNLCIAHKEIDTELAGYITQLPRLRELHLTRLKISDFEALSRSKSYKWLILHKIEGLDNSTVQLFDNITQLDIDSISEDLTGGIEKLKKLRKLRLEHTPVSSLCFLEGLKNLEEFKFEQKINDDNISTILPQLKKMRSFEYPLGDLAVLEQCPKIMRFCVDGESCENLHVLKGRHVESITVINARSKEDAMKIITEAQGYCERISSYGYNMPWEKQ